MKYFIEKLLQLLTALDISDRMPKDVAKHSIACNCDKCRGGR